MKKFCIFALSLLAGFTTATAGNVAKNAKVTLDGAAVSFYTIDNQTEKTTVDEERLSVFTDGELGANYRIAGYANEDDTAEGFTLAGQTFIIDLGATKENLNLIKVYFINAYAKAFTLEYSTDKSSWSTWEAVEGNTNETASSKLATAVSARYIRFIPQVPFVWNWGIAIKEIEVYENEAPALTTVKATAAKTSINVGETSQITASTADQFGDAIDATLSYASSDETVATVSADGLITAVAAGTATITVKASATVTTTIDITVKNVFALPATAPAAPTGDDVSVVYDGTTGSWSPAGWGWGSTQDDVTIAGKTCRKAEDLGSMQIENSLKDYTGFKSLVVDVYAAEEHTLNVYFEGEGTNKPVSLEAGWNKVEINITAIDGTKVNYLTFQYSNSPKDGVLVVSNVYYSKAEAADPFTLKVADGVATITGKVTKADADAINAADALLLDFSGATSVEFDININPLHANALIKANADSDGALAANNSGLAATRNLVRVATWVFPLTKLALVDDADEPYWNGEGTTVKFISTGDTGYTLTRHLDAGSIVTTCLPITVTAPDDIEVYEFTSDADNQLTFTKKANNEIVANVPYLLYAKAETDLVAEGTGDFVNGAAGSTTKGDVTFQGTYATILTDGTESFAGINPANQHLAWLGNGATVRPFRAYFAGITTAAAARIVLKGGNATAISSLAAQSADAAVYNLAGQRVAQPRKGLYIVGGKKVVVK